MTKRDEVHLLSGVYALGAVSDEEAALVEAAMAESEELRNEVVGLSDTAVALGLAVPPKSPPPALRARLLDAIESLPQEPVADEVEPEQLEEKAASVMPQGAHVAPRRRPRPRRRLPAVLLSAAAAAVLLFAGGFLVRGNLLEPQNAYARITAASDAHAASKPVAGGGTATVTWSRSEDGTAVVLHRVSVPSGKVLQLWSMVGKTITSEGLYRPQAGQNYEVLDGVPAAGEKLAVTVESHEVDQPTSIAIVAVPVRSA